MVVLLIRKGANKSNRLNNKEETYRQSVKGAFLALLRGKLEGVMGPQLSRRETGGLSGSELQDLPLRE